MEKHLRNEILKNLHRSELSVLRGMIEQVELNVGDLLYESFGEIDYLYFPENSLISLISVTQDGLTVEVAVIGSEGMLGAAAVFARNIIPYRATVQAAGKAHKIRLKTLKQLLPPDAPLRGQILFYLQAIHTQVAQSAICNRFHTVQERIAKWLLLSSDRIGEDELGYTHEFLSMILGARRTTVSRSLASLETLGLIRKRRASIIILKKKQLEAIACECYSVISAEFQHLS